MAIFNRRSAKQRKAVRRREQERQARIKAKRSRGQPSSAPAGAPRRP